MISSCLFWKATFVIMSMTTLSIFLERPKPEKKRPWNELYESTPMVSWELNDIKPRKMLLYAIR